MNATHTSPARQNSSARIHPDWCLSDRTWADGYVPALEGDVLVTVLQADSPRARQPRGYGQARNCGLQDHPQLGVSRALVPLLRDAAAECTGDFTASA